VKDEHEVSDPRIQPDLSTDKPRCSAECPGFTAVYLLSGEGVTSGPRQLGNCAAQGEMHQTTGSLCLPSLLAAHAELVQLRKRVEELERKLDAICSRW
jgi:hypothetical protein